MASKTEITDNINEDENIVELCTNLSENEEFVEEENKVVTKYNQFHSPTELQMIEYPGLVKNVDKMIETLGGIKTISHVFNGEQKRLALKYHYKNPYNKALSSDQHVKTGVLLSVKVRRSKRDPTRILHQEVTILGHTCKRHCFDSLCDFQFLPLLPEGTDKRVPNFVNVLEQLNPKDVLDIDYFNPKDKPLMCVPINFARSDTVSPGVFRNDNHEDGQHDTLGWISRSTYDNTHMVPFSLVDPFPTKPDPQTVKRMKLKYVSDEQYEKIQQLFKETPIWTRVALLHESGVSADKLKCILPSIAFYFHTGPWRTMYVRYGYDVRKDFKSRYYQVFDFRLCGRSGVMSWVSTRKQIIEMKNKNETGNGEDIIQDVDFPYLEENKLPRTRQCLMRYCDIHLSVVQDMLEKIPSPIHGAICNERTGWLPTGFDQQVRQIVRNTVKDVIRNHLRKNPENAEDMEAETEEFVDMEVDEDEAEDSEGMNESDTELPNDLEEMLESSDI